MKFEMTVEEKTFKSESGDTMTYLDYTVDMLGEPIKFAPKDSFKKLAEYLYGRVIKEKAGK